MAKKSKKNGPYIKDISEMDDTEFVKNIDYLSSPYYRAYVNARVRAELGYDAWQNGVDMREAERAAATDGKKRAYVNKRTFAVILITLLLLVMAAICAIGLFELSFSDYTAVFVVPQNHGEDEYVTMTSLVQGLFDDYDFHNVSDYFKSVFNEKTENASAMEKIALYAAPVACVILFVITVFGFLKSLVSLFRGAKNGAYHKYKFGFISILTLLCSAVIIFGGMYIFGMTADAIGDFFMGTSTVLNASYGAYAILVIPVLTFILSCVSYKKEKKITKRR